MANILLPNAKVEFVQAASAGCRLKTIVAGKEIFIKKANSGFEGANCVDFGMLCIKYEIGNLSQEKVKEYLVTIARDGFLDLSGLALVEKVKDIPADKEYIFIQRKAKDVFDFMPPYIVDSCDDEDDGIFEVDEDGEED